MFDTRTPMLTAVEGAPTAQAAAAAHGGDAPLNHAAHGLPSAPERARPQLASAARSAPKVATFVLIEAETMFRQLLRDALCASAGLRCKGDYAGLAEGLTACMSLTPTLAIIGLPRGETAAGKRIRDAIPRLPATRLLALVGDKSPDVISAVFNAGAHGCIVKQAGVDVLQQAVRRLLAGQTYYGPTTTHILLEALRPGESPRAPVLTERERAILRSVASSEPIKALSGRLHVSQKTLQNQLYTLKRKLGIRDVAGLVRYAIRAGLGNASD